MIYTIISSYPIWKKEEPRQTSRNVGVLKPGDIIQSTEIKNGWVKTQGAWFYSIDKNGNSIISADIKKVNKSVDKILGRVYYDREDPVNITPNPNANYFPDKQASCIEDGIKITVTNNGDGTYTQQRVSTNANGKNQVDTYVTDSSGQTISIVYESEQEGGFRNTTTYDADGNRKEVRYDTIDGLQYKIETAYDSNGKWLSQRKTALAPSNDRLSNDEAVELLSAAYVPSYAYGKLNIYTLYGILGAPYQWMDSVDTHIPDVKIGRFYADRLLAKLPLLFIQPGEPKFLSGWDDEERGNFLESVLRGLDRKAQLSNFSRMQGRFYIFEPKWDVYRRYIRPLTSAAAIFLKLKDYKVPGMNFDIFNSDWSDFTPEATQALFARNMNGAVYYINGDVQISDNFSNSTNQSQLEQKVNGFSDLAKEIQFLLGSTASQVGIDVNSVQTGQSMNAENAHEFASDLLGRGNFLEQISQNLLTVLQGGKLIFPEIWGDSQYDKSYNVNIKLRSPDADPLSWFMNIWVPIAHLLPLVLPKSSGPNGYIAPFLVRAWYKGLFHCPMGIITNCSINRGELGNWNLQGLPMSVDINLTIKDLYHSLAVTMESTSWDNLAAMENIGILDYISNFCGVNMVESDIDRTIQFYINAKTSAGAQIYDAIGNNLERRIGNFIRGMWSDRY